MKKKTSSPFLLLKLLFNHKLLGLIALFCAIISSLSEVFTTQLIGKSVDYMVGPDKVNFSGVAQTILHLMILYFVGAIAIWLLGSFSSRIAHTISCELRQNTFHKLEKLPLSYFDQTSHGDIISHFTNDLDNISDALSLSLLNLFSGVITIIAVLSMMLYYSPKITLVVLLVTPLNFIVVWFVTRASQSRFTEQQSIMGKLSGFVSEMVGNQKVVKVLGYEQESIDEFYIINENLHQTGKKAHFASAMINPSTRAVDHLSYMCVGIIGGLTAMTSPNITIGVVSMFLMFSTQFAKPFNNLSNITTNIQTATVSLERIQNILNEMEETPDAPNAITLSNVNGDVIFDNVSFSYNKKQSLIKNLNINAPTGSLIAIVGPTGAGKSTIINLLMRFYEVDDGHIELDGTNIIHYTKDSLRKAFGMVLQETWLFHGSVRENIAYGKPDASNAEIIQAASFAYADTFIQQMPQGYDTIISEDSGNLSQGQKQLLTIARVMLTNPSLLILDEATSSIDSLTEQHVQKAFLTMLQGRTSFVIAHRLSTIMKADTILVLNKGKIIETGTHKELLSKQGFYYELYQSQFE